MSHQLSITFDEGLVADQTACPVVGVRLNEVTQEGEVITRVDGLVVCTEHGTTFVTDDAMSNAMQDLILRAVLPPTQEDFNAVVQQAIEEAGGRDNLPVAHIVGEGDGNMINLPFITITRKVGDQYPISEKFAVINALVAAITAMVDGTGSEESVSKAFDDFAKESGLEAIFLGNDEGSEEAAYLGNDTDDDGYDDTEDDYELGLDEEEEDLEALAMIRADNDDDPDLGFGDSF